ncbi:MAG: GNAT family N-acetyltransferase [Thermodesulfobacteriota bacterium]|nr:GNAT family N-acetyltransferase [Thermodesulfobacteriota bacterium]
MTDIVKEQVRIREATADDLPALLKLYGQLGMDNGQVLPLDLAESLFLRISNYPDYRIYLAEDRYRSIGTFALLIMDNLGHMGAPSAIIEDVVVSDSCRGQGVGQEMMAFATDLARAKGCYKFFFSSNINRTYAHRFYENLGFEKHGYSFYLNV